MKKIVIYVKANCIACEYAKKVIHELCKDKDITIRVACDLKPDDKISIFPTVSFYNDNNIEVARISSTMPKDFYKTVIDNFEKL